ncbi:uncharacterized protein BKA55DRAFT_524014 [Fusarium redolens]|uniref:F-box domain-containing protein n=1 Tax=Fusarium redolens TaxID=48865 RepID=A0A9P9G1U2_FUSRE|nr:uncharacterized protein BKA55DRAFT_524014 [Fusarium redolens]KAH7231670.1 hypothetical protein BKA55DRAFT_524014 [Fusarium redolens]
MPTISHLPIEMLCSIANLLDDEAFFRFRQTSQLINNSTASQFATRYFERRCVFLQRHSLEALIDIARHPTFGPTVQSLDISIAHITKDPDLWERDMQYRPEEGNEKEKAVVNTIAYSRYQDDQRYIMECGMATAYLTLALTAMPNCRTIILSGQDRPWGARLQAKQTGLWPTTNTDTIESGEFARHALQVVLAAVVASRVSLEELDILFNLQDFRAGSHEFVSDLAAQQIRSCFLDLDTLRLNVCSEYFTLSDSGAGSLVRFIELFPTATLLDLRMGGRNKLSLVTAIAGSLQMTALRELELHWVNCTADALVKILCRHQGTLKDVLFNGVHIHETQGWPLIFCVLRDKLSVESLLVANCLSAKQWVRFRKPGGEERGIQIRCDWDSLTSAIDRIVLEKVENPRMRSHFGLSGY